MTKAIVLLLKLYELELAGKADSDESEAVRSDLDPQWKSLTEEEKATWIKISDYLPIQKVIFK
jgi:hypothetical protein